MLCTANTANVFEIGITLPGRSDGQPSSDHAVSTAATYNVKDTLLARKVLTAICTVGLKL